MSSFSSPASKTLRSLLLAVLLQILISHDSQVLASSSINLFRPCPTGGVLFQGNCYFISAPKRGLPRIRPFPACNTGQSGVISFNYKIGRTNLVALGRALGVANTYLNLARVGNFWFFPSNVPNRRGVPGRVIWARNSPCVAYFFGTGNYRRVRCSNQRRYICVRRAVQYTAESLGDPTLLVVAGEDSSQSAIASVESHALDGTCASFLEGNYNVASTELVSVRIGGSPVVCGQEGASVTCRAYNAPSDSWNVLGSLPSASGPYYVFRTSPNNFAILGPNVNDVYDSAAMAFTGAALTGTMNWEAGSGVCVVNIDNDRVLVAGGDSLMNGAGIYDHAAGTFTETPPMMETRSGHSCGLIDNAGSLKVVITGTVVKPSGAESVTEIYDVSGDSWSVGNPTPVVLSGAATVAFGTTFLLVGGESHPNPGMATTALPTSTVGTKLDTIYEYDIATGMWTLRTETLRVARSDHTAVFLTSA